jgi:multidrug efflux pump subunit AcrA (membrane-fusion protein)
MMKTKRQPAIWLCALLLLSACGKRGGGDQQIDEIYEVTRGNFNIVISATGTLDAIKRYDIKAPRVSKRGLTIIEAVDDQTPLKKGDLIVACSDEDYLDEMESQHIKVDDAEKTLMVLEQDYQMKTADSVSQIKSSSDSRRDSQEELEKYVNEDAPLKKKNLQQAVEATRSDVEEEESNLAGLKEDLLSASMGDEETRSDLEDKIESSEKMIKVLDSTAEEAEYNLRIFKQYTYPQSSRRLQQNLVKAEMNLQKQLVNASSERIQLQRKIDSQQRVLASFRKQLVELEENIEMLRITAPVDGVISYGDPDPRQRHREQKEIAVGTSLNPSELIGTIPDLSRLLVNLNVPEASRSKVAVGMRSEMRIKALPNLQLTGEVSKISDMASNLNFWDRTSPKIYPTVVSINESYESLRTGMTVEVDMIAAEVKEVIYVPVEALYTKEGKVFCRVQKALHPEEREVTIDRSSKSYVEVLSGLEPGDKVFLSREEP